MTFATEIAARIVAFSFEMMPAEAVHWAKIGVLDTIGVTLAGAGQDCSRILGRVLGLSPGPSVVFGTSRTTFPLDAALVNGTASHALDFDDSSNSMGGHPSAPVLSAILALAGEVPLTGRELLTAYVAGFEAETRIARAVQFAHYDKGWHPTATLGTFGAAAACARMLNLTGDQTARALALAVSLASGVKANFGTMTKPLHVGHCARSGLMAAMLAREGFSANNAAFEHRQGFFAVFNGEGNFDASRALEDWATPLDIVSPGIAIKQYPCCGSAHPAIDVMIDLVREHGMRPSNVDHVDVWIHPRRLAHTNRPKPASPLDAKFSLQYCVARALAGGKVVLADFEGERYADPATLEIMSRIHAAPHPDMAMANTQHFGAEIQVRTRDGRILSKSTDRPLGRGPDKPLPLSMLEAKFKDCAGRAIDGKSAATALDMVWHLDEIEQVSILLAILLAGAKTHSTLNS